MNSASFIKGSFEKYDTRLLEDRALVEGNVCGCLLHNLTLFDDLPIKAKDFITHHGRNLYKIIEELRNKGNIECDELTYTTNISSEAIKVFEEEGFTWKSIATIKSVVKVSNWDAIIDNFYKSNTLLKLSTKGFNILDKTDTFLDDDGKTKIEMTPYEYFKTRTSTEVIDYYEGVVAKLATTINSTDIVEEAYIDFDDAWIEAVSKREEMGYGFDKAGESFCGEEISTFPFMSQEILGLKPGTLSAWAAHSGCGKTTYMVTVLMSLVSQGLKVIFVSNEMDVKDLKTMFLIWILYRYFEYDKLTKKRFLAGDWTEEDRNMIMKARDYWRDHYAKSIKIVTLSDANCKLTCDIVKTHIDRDGCNVFIVDTMKMTTSETNDDAVWLALNKDVRSLTKLAQQKKVIGIMTIQLALSSLNRSWLDASCLANCKSIKETLTNLIMFRKALACELDPNSPYYIKPFRYKKNKEGEWIREPWEPDATKTWKIFFIDKCRRGRDSGDTGEAFLVRHDGDHCSFYESARCCPTHKLFATDNK